MRRSVPVFHRLRVSLAAAGLALASLAGAARPFVDDAGRTVMLPDRVERVYAAGPPASVLVFALAPDKLIGWTRAFRPDEAAWIASRYADLPDLGRLTGRGNTANVETVIRAKPDLIIDVGSTSPTFVSLAERVQEQTGIPYVLLDGHLDASVAQIEKAARAIGAEARGRQLAVYAERLIGALRSKIAAVPAEGRPSVYYARGAQGNVTGLEGSINVEMLEFLGARNVAAGRRGGLATVGLEQVVLWDPQVIVTNDPNFYREIWTLPLWGSARAVRDRRVYLSPHLPFGWFDYPPGINRLIGLEWLAEILYPEAFHFDYRREVGEFYRLFYHQAPTPAQLDALLGEPGVAPR